MKKAQVAVLGVALASGAAAWWLMSGSAPPPPPAAPLVEAVPSVKTTGVLVANRDLPMGALTTAADFRWQASGRGSLLYGPARSSRFRWKLQK